MTLAALLDIIVAKIAAGCAVCARLLNDYVRADPLSSERRNIVLASSGLKPALLANEDMCIQHCPVVVDDFLSSCIPFEVVDDPRLESLQHKVLMEYGTKGAPMSSTAGESIQRIMDSATGRAWLRKDPQLLDALALCDMPEGGHHWRMLGEDPDMARQHDGLACACVREVFYWGKPQYATDVLYALPVRRLLLLPLPLTGHFTEPEHGLKTHLDVLVAQLGGANLNGRDITEDTGPSYLKDEEKCNTAMLGRADDPGTDELVAELLKCHQHPNRFVVAGAAKALSVLAAHPQGGEAVAAAMRAHAAAAERCGSHEQQQADLHGACMALAEAAKKRKRSE